MKSVYRIPNERDEYVEEPMKEPKKPLPAWVWHMATMVGASVAIGGFAEGCVRTGYQGIFGGLIGAACLVGVGGMVRMMVRYSP